MDLSWKTKIYRLEDIRPGHFSIRRSYLSKLLLDRPLFWQQIFWSSSCTNSLVKLFLFWLGLSFICAKIASLFLQIEFHTSPFNFLFPKLIFCFCLCLLWWIDHLVVYRLSNGSRLDYFMACFQTKITKNVIPPYSKHFIFPKHFMFIN